MGYFCFRKICAAAARLAAALVLFGGSLVGGEALLAAAGGGNVAHATASDFQVDWEYSPTQVRFYWTGAPDNNRYGLAIYTGRCTNVNCTYGSNTANRIHNVGGAGTGQTNLTNQGGTRQALIDSSLFSPNQEYSFHFRQGTGGAPSTHYFTSPAAVGKAISITVNFGRQLGAVDATLTWEKDSEDLTSWDVEVLQGATTITSAVGIAAAARSRAFGAVFARGTDYSFRIRGHNNADTGSWQSATFAQVTLAAPLTPVLRGLYAGVSLYLVKNSVNSDYVALYNDGTARSVVFSAPASVTVGGVFVHNIAISPEAANAVLVTIWGAHTHGVSSTLSGASALATARGIGGRIAPTTVRAITVTPVSGSFTDIVFEWDRPANDGGGPVITEISYGGTLTVADSIGSDGVAPRRAITLSSPVFGAAKHANTSIDEIAVTLRARNGDSNLVSPQTVFNVAADSNAWPNNPSSPDPEILTVVATVESSNLYFYVFMDVGGKSEPNGVRILRAGTNFSGIDTSDHQNNNYRLDYESPGWPPNPVNAFKNIVRVKIRPGNGSIPGSSEVDVNAHTAADYPSGTVSVRFYATGTRNGDWKGFYYELFSTPGALAVEAQPGNAFLQISATAADDGFIGDGNGTLPLNYQYIHPISGNTIAFSTVGAANFSITALANGRAYTVSVRYSNDSGAFSSWAFATASLVVPGPPEILEFLGFDSRVSAAATNVVSLRWNVDFKGAQGSVILSDSAATQTVAYSPVGGYHNHLVTVDENEQNKTLVYTIFAKSYVGDSGMATATLFVSLGAPSAPLSLSITVNGEGSLSLSWSAPNNIGGATITGYLVYVNATVTATVAVASTSIQLSGVAFAPNGREYNIGVAAANPRGIGATAAAAATAIGKPGAPQSLTVRGGAGIAVFEWTAANNSGSELLGYSITYADSGGADTGVSVAPTATDHTIGGLGNGVYTYTMFAFNALGNGAGVTAADITSAVGAPLPPQSVGVNPGPNQIGISWGVDSTTPNGASITAFLLYSDDTTMAVATLTDPMARSHIFTGLTATTAYTLGVAAQSSLGLGDRRNFIATPLSVPGAPASFVATPGFRQIALVWSEAGTFGGTIVAFYLNGQSVAASVNSTVITGLTTGVEYAYTLQASNSIGIGIASVVTAIPIPGAPQNVMAESLLNFVSLSWEAAADDSNDSNITYEVYANSAAQTPVAANLTELTQLFTVGMHGVTVGSTSTVGVAARNAGGRSPIVFATVTVYGAPSAPTLETPEELNREVVLSWIAPASDGGLAISLYEVAYSAGGGATTTLTLNNPAALAATVSGLTNDQEHTFVVRAVNRLGGGDTATTTATPKSGPPGRPQNFMAVATPVIGEISLFWEAPSNDGGSDITSYVVYVDGAASMTMTLASSARSHSITGLATRQDYSVGVAAANVNGEGKQASVPVVSPLDAPGAPGAFAAVATFPTVVVSWTEGDTHNGEILRYVINGATLDATARMEEYIVPTVGAQVYSIYAVNVGGNGDTVAITVTVAAIKPKAPVLAAPQPSPTLATGISIGWSAPANNGGASITAYIVYVNSVAAQTVGGDVTYYLLTVDEQTNTLEYGEAYAIGVAAQNSVGIGVTATAVGNLLSAPGMPPNFVAASVSDGRVFLLWGEASANGAVVTDYVLTRVTPAGGSPESLGADARGITVGGLLNGTDYVYELYAVNAEGNGATATVTANPGRTPGAPGNFRASAVDENGYVTLMWTEPTDTGGRNITGYNLLYIKATMATPGASWTPATAPATATSRVFGLEASVAYRFSLQAVNSFGGGAWAGAQSGGNQAAELDKAILPVAAAALSRQWSQAINQRLSQVGAVGGGGLQANALGASFGKGQMERGFAELLRKHGGALANGKELDGAALRNFAFSLGGGAGAGAGATGGGGMGAGYSNLLNGGGIWGGASYTNMENQRGETPWEGDNIAYYAGIDRAMDAERRLLAGVMFAHNRLETSYTRSSDNSAGEYNLRATGAHPYLLWKAADNASRLWATFGYGAGEVEFAQANQAKTTRDAKIYSASGGFRRNLWSNAKGAEVDGQADFAVANIEVENPGEANSKAGSKNFRALLEARNRVQMANGGEASPFMRAGFRHQSDDVASKSGWEFAAGWRWNAKGGGWNGEVSGGAAGLSGGYKEWSANAMLRKNDAGGKGLWLTLRPQYGVNGGNPVAASGDFWRAMQVKDNNAKDRAASLSLDVGYGLFGASALWRPFVGATIGARAGEYRAGAKWESRLRADMGMSAGVFAKRKPAAADQMQVNFAVAY